MANKAIKYRLYPNEEQAVLFSKTFGCCRKIWNLMLSDKIAYYETNNKLLKNTPAQYKGNYPYLKEVDSLALCNVQLDLEGAYKKFFKENNVGLPKFKSKHKCKDSYTTNDHNGTIAVLDKGIKLPKVGVVKAKIHRRAPAHWKLKSATISRDKDGKYYISVLYEYEKDNSNTPVSLSKAVGLDYKSDGLFYSSDGEIGSSHKYFHESNKKLAREQRKLSRMREANISGYKVVNGKRYPIYKRPLSECKNYQKTKIKVAKLHKKIVNQRLDNLHKLSAKIANSYDIVCVESLNMRAMANKKFGNGKATMDNGYGIFLNLLEYKLKDRGKVFVKIDKWFPSSQLCSCCGFRKKLTLKDRIYVCDNCGTIIDRDYNAAINILNEGLRIASAA